MKKDNIKMSMMYYGKRYELILDKTDIVKDFEHYNWVRQLKGKKPLTLREALKSYFIAKVADQFD